MFESLYCNHTYFRPADVEVDMQRSLVRWTAARSEMAGDAWRDLLRQVTRAQCLDVIAVGFSGTSYQMRGYMAEMARQADGTVRWTLAVDGPVSWRGIELPDWGTVMALEALERGEACRGQKKSPQPSGNRR